MAVHTANIIDKYQGLAPQGVIKAVQTAAAKTGTDFSFLMEKAAAESSFNPKAKARTSSATGLFQFIDSTWLGMVKKHGHKYGLGNLAKHIDTKGGRPCVDNCDIKDKILDLRKDPQLSALMAGEFTAENRAVLQKNTKGKVVATELYLAHFMGAGGACKFLNSKACNPDALAKDLFPKAARANKNVFYDRATGKPRTLNDIYTHFAKKFGEAPDQQPISLTDNGGKPSNTENRASSPALHTARISAPSPAPAPLPSIPEQALPVFDDANERDDIIWHDDPRFFPRPVEKPYNPFENISPVNILTLAEMQAPPAASRWGRRDAHGYNS